MYYPFWDIDISDFSDSSVAYHIMFATTGFLAGICSLCCYFAFRNKTEAKRIEELSDYLEQVNMGKAAVLSASGEDIFPNWKMKYIRL